MKEMFPLLFPASYFLYLAIERIVPSKRPQPQVRWWVAKGAAFFMLGGVINAIVPQVLARTLPAGSGLDLSALGIAGGVVVAYFAATFGHYWMHRTFHRSTVMWRLTHQLHHSGERVDIAGFGFGHPFELVLATTVPQIIVALIGVDPVAGMIAGYLGFMTNLTTHLNVDTPHWLGYLLQRPEMHSIHHERGVHAYNYGLPLWDRLFGTYRNPEKLEVEAHGFWDGASTKVLAMLAFQDVSANPAASTVPAVAPGAIKSAA